jgi:hypothetical protein
VKWYVPFLSAVFATTGMAAQNDPFVGTWVYNAEKSPKPTIRYAIKDLGSDHYALTGSSGETTEIKADGISIRSPSGDTVSFKKQDDHTWRMDRVDTRTMVRTYTVSSDDKTLTLVDIFTAPDGGRDKTITTYARLAPGHSIYGEWQSISLVEENSGKPESFIIERYGREGLSFSFPSTKQRTQMNFDGKVYLEEGPGHSKRRSTSGKRISSHLLELDGQINGQPDDKEEFKLSEDGKTLTMISKPVNSPAVFTTVWDRK